MLVAGIIASGSVTVGVPMVKAQAVGSQVPAFQKEFQIDPESAKVSYFDSSGTEKRDFKGGESFTAKIEFAIPDTAKAGDYATAPVINKIAYRGSNETVVGWEGVGELRTDALPLKDTDTGVTIAYLIPHENGHRVVVSEEGEDLVNRKVVITTKSSLTPNGFCDSSLKPGETTQHEARMDLSLFRPSMNPSASTGARVVYTRKPCEVIKNPRPTGYFPIPQMSCSRGGTDFKYVSERNRVEAQIFDPKGYNAGELHITPGSVPTFEVLDMKIDLGSSDPSFRLDKDPTQFSLGLENVPLPFDENHLLPDNERDERVENWTPLARYPYPTPEVAEDFKKYLFENEPDLSERVWDDPEAVRDASPWSKPGSSSSWSFGGGTGSTGSTTSAPSRSSKPSLPKLYKNFITKWMEDNDIVNYSYDKDTQSLTIHLVDKDNFLSAPKDSYGNYIVENGLYKPSHRWVFVPSMKDPDTNMLTLWAPFTDSEKYQAFLRYATDNPDYGGVCMSSLGAPRSSELSGVAVGEPLPSLPKPTTTPVKPSTSKNSPVTSTTLVKTTVTKASPVTSTTPVKTSTTKTSPVTSTTPVKTSTTKTSPATSTTPVKTSTSQASPATSTTPVKTSTTKTSPATSTTPVKTSTSQASPATSTTSVKTSTSQASPVTSTTPAKPSTSQASPVTSTTSVKTSTMKDSPVTSTTSVKTSTTKTSPVTSTTSVKTSTTKDSPAPTTTPVDAPPTHNQPVTSTPIPEPGTINGTVVWDRDTSRSISDGDEHIPGLTVILKRDGKEVSRTVTDEHGFYEFPGLEPGDYTIEVIGPDGAIETFDDREATVEPGETDTGNDWGFKEPFVPGVPVGSLSGTVVWDEDRSKTVNDGDERIHGLTVVVFKDGKEVARTTTDENGFYKFEGLEPGKYGIAVHSPDGGELFFEDKVATVVTGEEDTGNDWGFVREDAPAPVPSGVVRKVLASTGVSGFALTGLGALVTALGALFVVRRRK